jgi:hypothetical protein
MKKHRNIPEEAKFPSRFVLAAEIHVCLNPTSPKRIDATAQKGDSWGFDIRPARD